MRISTFNPSVLFSGCLFDVSLASGQVLKGTLTGNLFTTYRRVIGN